MPRCERNKNSSENRTKPTSDDLEESSSSGCLPISKSRSRDKSRKKDDPKPSGSCRSDDPKRSGSCRSDDPNPSGLCRSDDPKPSGSCRSDDPKLSGSRRSHHSTSKSVDTSSTKHELLDESNEDTELIFDEEEWKKFKMKYCNNPLLSPKDAELHKYFSMATDAGDKVKHKEFPKRKELYKGPFVEGIVEELVDNAIANSTNIIAENIVNDAVYSALQNTPECIAMGIINKIVDKMPDEKILYSTEHMNGVHISQVVLDGSEMKRKHFFLLMSKTHLKKVFKQLFLPHGFPNTVSSDYAEYQVWDSLQAFFSTLTGAITTHSVMKGFGVGDAEATALSAALTWMLRDGAGLIGRIAFAYWKGREFDMDCKKWRLFADILNDIAMFFECMIPVLTPSRPLYFMCISTTMKSLVGVAGGATRAALTQHQAIKGNMADVSAKDQSQESCVNLIASIVGILVLMTVADSRFKWDMFAFFVFSHLICNYRAVKSVQLATLNTARFVLILRVYFLLKFVGSVSAINRYESVIIGRGYGVADLCGFNINLGVSLKDVKITKTKLYNLLEQYRKYRYMIHVDQVANVVQVFLKTNAGPTDIIQAYYHAIILAIATCMQENKYLMIVSKQYPLMHNTPIDVLADIIHKPHSKECEGNVCLIAAETLINKDFPIFLRKLQSSGWDVEHLLFPMGEWRLRV